MSRFDYVDDDGQMPWELWQNALSSALGGCAGQRALAEMEAALVAMPRPRLIEGVLAEGGEVCAIGAFVAHRRAQREGVDFTTAVEALVGRGDLEDPHETAEAGRAEGMKYTVAWHLEYLNDEKFASATPEERHRQMLAWVRRAQGKDEAVAA